LYRPFDKRQKRKHRTLMIPSQTRRVAAAFVVSLSPCVSHAWGAAEHRLIAEAASVMLSTSARAQVETLLSLEPGSTLPSISTWADEVRDPRTARWHYVAHTDRASCELQREKDCPDGRCVVDALMQQASVLRSRTASPQERLVALKWVVHLVADVHQPLHAGFSDDKGGNTFQVQALGHGTNLHALWDSGLAKRWPGGMSALQIAVAGLARRPTKTGTPEQWAIESCEVVQSSGFYPATHVVTEAYFLRWQPTVASRMAAAARRLVDLLELTLQH